jgi:hypothetical protein
VYDSLPYLHAAIVPLRRFDKDALEMLVLFHVVVEDFCVSWDENIKVVCGFFSNH